MNLNKIKKIYNTKVGSAIKLVISFIIIGVFIQTLDMQKLKQTSAYISLNSIIILFLITLIRNFIGAVRFKILSSEKCKISISEIMKQYFIASFFNNFLPGAIGGDGIRLLLMIKIGISKIDAGIMILFERIIGFYSLIIIAFISSFFWNTPSNIFYLVLITTVIYSIGILLIFSNNRMLKKHYKNKFVNLLRKSSDIYMGNYLILSKTFAVSLLYHFISVYLSFYVAQTVNVYTSILPFLTLVPLVWVFTTIPIGLGGLGLREVSFVYLLSLIGIFREQSLIISLGTYISLVLSGFIGIYLLTIDKIRKNYGEK